MTGREPCQAPVYELTVVGALGPVLCSALRPYVSACSEMHTVIRADAPGDTDLVDLVRLLESRGMDIATISLIA